MSRRCMGCMEMYSDELNVCPHCGYVYGTSAEESVHIAPMSLLHDRYIVGKVLGYGGFGVTYLGWDGKLEQKVAIKEYLPSEFSTRMPGQTQVTVFNGAKGEQFSDGLNKFIDEAKRLAKFQNEPGIVKIFDSFQENDTAYIVMEYLEGITLTQYLQQVGTVNEDKAVEMLWPVMESLEVVHSKGLLHRDIAPDNIFLTKSGEVKLIDFGASRYATTTHSRSLTVIVKPGYSPEEQYRSRGDQGTHTDVYSIGATLYRMITGETPPDAMERRAKYENQNKDILVEPHKIKKISRGREVAILNALNVRIEDRTPDIKTLMEELNADPPAKRKYGKIKKIDIYAWPLWLKIVAPSALALLIALGVLVSTGVILKNVFNVNVEGMCEVPNIIGKQVEEAKKIDEFKKKKLKLEQGFDIIGNEEEADTIVNQQPRGGEYWAEGTQVFYNTYSGTRKEEYLPYVDENGNIFAGKSIVGTSKNTDEYEAIIKKEYSDKGIAFEEVGEYSEEQEGTILEFKTSDGKSLKKGDKLKEGDTIVVVYSKGAAPVEIGDYLNKDKDEAAKAIRSAGFTVAFEAEHRDDYPEGTVFEQDPPAGSKLAKGETITLTYATPEPTSEIKNVKGKTKSEVKDILKDFKVSFKEIYDREVDESLAIGTSPEAGTTQEKGETIVVYISKGPQPVQVTFDYNGATKTGPRSMTAYVGKPYNYGGNSLPKESDGVIRDGYHLSGWSFSENYTAQIATDDTVVSAQTDHTLYANWSAGNYGVTFINSNKEITTLYYDYDSKYSDLPILTSNDNPGHTFKGWKLENGTTIKNGDTVKITSDYNAYAQWEANHYTVTFEPGQGEPNINTKVTYGEKYSTFPVVTRTGYTFDGWYTQSNGGTKVSSSDTYLYTNGITLYAHWTAKKYTVTFNPGEGTCGTGTKSVTYGEKYGSLPTPTRDYYTFKGWYTQTGGNGTKITESSVYNKADNTTLYASWTEKRESDWTKASNVPSGARITNTKWTYTYRDWQTSSSSSMSGYTRDDSKTDCTVSWSNEVKWFDSPRSESETYKSAGTRTVEDGTETYQSGTEHHWHYYHRHHYNTDLGKWVWGSRDTIPYPSDGEHEYDTTEKLQYNYEGDYYWQGVKYHIVWYKTHTCPQCGATGMWILDNEYDKPIYSTRPKYKTQYGYRRGTKVYTYYFYKDIAKESASDPTGQSGISNVQKWVKYREK